MRMEGIAPKIHDDHIAGEGKQSTASLQFGTQIYSYAPSNEDTCSQSSSGQRIGKIGEIFCVESGESLKQIWCDQWSKEKGREST